MFVTRMMQRDFIVVEVSAWRATRTSTRIRDRSPLTCRDRCDLLAQGPSRALSSKRQTRGYVFTTPILFKT